MAAMMRRSVQAVSGDLRFEPAQARIRAALSERMLVDSVRAVLVWEPHRLVPSWAVPVEDVLARLVPSRSGSVPGGGRGVLTPADPFGVHTSDGVALDVVDAGGGDAVTLAGAAWQLHDDDLEGYVVLDFSAFDAWWEEDERRFGHPRDPFHRLDVLPSSRHVQVEAGGEVLAESSRPVLLVETMLPTRFYLPREDVSAELVPSTTRSTCAYKGHASYFSPCRGEVRLADAVWSYEDPAPEVARIAGLVAFFDEHVDVVVDGVRRERPVTPWSRGS